MKLVWRYVTLFFIFLCCYFTWKLVNFVPNQNEDEHLFSDNNNIEFMSHFSCKQRDLVYGTSSCRLQSCRTGYFRLSGMDSCREWLTCDDIEDRIHVQKLIGTGAVKRVYLAEWKGFQVAYCNLTTREYREDFQHGVDMIKMFQASQHIVQLIGHCEESVVLEYHPLHSAENLNQILSKSENQHLDNALFRFLLSINYVEIILFLHHTNPYGVYVMCDSNDVTKTLSQFLLTDDFRLLVSDLDALPRLDPKKENLVKCGHRQLFGDFVAPEQLWPNDDREFNDSEMPGYDEKTDIWKIPSVVDFILGDSPGSDAIRFHLFKIHKRCKEAEPKLRPSAQEILDEYILVYSYFQNDGR